MDELTEETVTMIMDLFAAVYGPLRNDSMLRSRLAVRVTVALSAAFVAGQEDTVSPCPCDLCRRP